jgi:hypothetical protein
MLPRAVPRSTRQLRGTCIAGHGACANRQTYEETAMAKTVIASFDSFHDAQQTLAVLQREGFRTDDVSIVGSGTTDGYPQGGTGALDVPPGSRAEDMRSATPVERATGELTQDAPAALSDTGKGAAVGAATGGVLGGAAGLAVALMGLTIPGIGPLVAAGPLAAALAGAGLGAVAGGLLGGLTSVGVPEHEAHVYAEAVRRGGALVLVRADDDADALRAAALLREHGAVDIDNRAEQWRAQGWQRHEPMADAQTGAQARTYGTGTGLGMGMTAGTRSDDRVASDHTGYAHHGDVRQGSDVSSVSANTVGADAGMTAPLGVATLGVGAVRQSASARDDMAADRQVLDTTREARAGTGLGSSTASTASAVGSAVGSASALTTPRLDDPYRQHFNQHFSQHAGDSGSDQFQFEHYEPAYRYGEDLRDVDRYRGRRWEEIELSAREDWERRYPDQAGSGWDRVRSAVRYGWERTKDTLERALPGDADRDGR